MAERGEVLRGPRVANKQNLGFAWNLTKCLCWFEAMTHHELQ